MMSPRMERTLCQRRSSCLLFQMLGVETCSFLPDDQRDRGNLPRQGEASHRWAHPLGKQSLVKIVERSGGNAGRRTWIRREFHYFRSKLPENPVFVSEYLQQSLDFHNRSFSPPGVLVYEFDGVSHSPTFGRGANSRTEEWVGSAGV